MLRTQLPAARRSGEVQPPAAHGKISAPRMLCAAIDIGSNTTRVLVAEPEDGQLRGVMDQKAFTRLGQASGDDGAIGAEKVAEVADAVATQVRLAEELDADAIRIVATAAMREAANRDEV